jgi:N-acetylglucosaminyldiphosphoundecaprenol N-acetyl-beta-D-mannosaminyltransferase
VKELELLGARVTAQRYDEAIERMLAAANGQAPRLRGHFVNVHQVVEARHDPALRTVFRHAPMTFADGMPIVWLSRSHGASEAERVCGPDVMLSICDRGRDTGLRHYFFGGRPGVAEALAAALQARFPGLEVAGVFTPPFRARIEPETPATIDSINATSPNVVWVGLGAPKQEFWVARHGPELTAGLVLPVGAAFDFLSNRVRRAPTWMRRVGLEWLFRLAMDPRRLAGRYFRTNAEFLYLVGRDVLGRRSI